MRNEGTAMAVPARERHENGLRQPFRIFPGIFRGTAMAVPARERDENGVEWRGSA
jgi:hypothetical protein